MYYQTKQMKACPLSVFQVVVTIRSDQFGNLDTRLLGKLANGVADLMQARALALRECKQNR